MKHSWKTTYKFFVKPFDEICKISHHRIERTGTFDALETYGGNYNIHHSSGLGGGLVLSKHFIHTFCGTGKKLSASYWSSKYDRHLFGVSHQDNPGGSENIYSEWLSTEPMVFLDEDLFEI